MDYVTVNESTIPALGFGTFKLKGQACESSVTHAIEIGYRHLDTARMYDNEAAVGNGIRAGGIDRDKLFITSKIWRDDLAPDRLKSEAAASLANLRVDYLDLLLIHWPNPDIPIGDTIGAMRELQDKGDVRLIGVSNFTPSMVEEAARHGTIAANQVEYHPYLAQQRLTRQAREMGYMLTAYSPLARGKICDDETLRKIADAHGKSPSQVTLRWFLQQAQVAAIPKAASAEHRAANLAIFDFELSDEEMQAIHALNRDQREIDPDFAPEWER